MMFLAQMGLGLLANLVCQSGMHNSQMAQQQQQALTNLRQSLNEAARDAYQQTQHPWDQKTAFLPFEVDAPPFPDQAAQKLSQMQQTNASERAGFVQNTKDELADLKDGFFAFNHLETQEQPDGRARPQVILNDQGRPNVQPGPETPEQKTARNEYETKAKSELQERHEEQRTTLMKQEQDSTTAFLQNNKPDLGNPAVQAELQKMIMLSHKKALNMSRQQHEELVKSDLYTPEQVEAANDRLGQLRDMEDRHAEMEDSSPEAATLYQHQQDLAELLRQKHEEVRQTKFEEAFLKGPPQFGSPNTKPIDVAEVLPPYLSNALYNMGIYSV